MPKFVLLGSVAVLSLTMLSSAGRAADVVVPAEVPSGWQGFYLGVFGGHNDTSFDWHE